VHNIAPMPPLERFIGLFDIFLSLSPDVSRDTVLAAMASGLPIVAPPIVPIAYPVSDENQPWVRGNPGESLRQLVNSARLGKESGEANRRRALAQFDIEKTAATYQRLFDSAIALRSAQ
jgi:glycosyltransferase involved in cell wall biosynthesis